MNFDRLQQVVMFIDDVVFLVYFQCFFMKAVLASNTTLSNVSTPLYVIYNVFPNAIYVYYYVIPSTSTS